MSRQRQVSKPRTKVALTEKSPASRPWYETTKLCSLVGGVKGGVGKSLFARLLIELYHRCGKKPALVDFDRIARNARDVLALVEDCLQPQNKALVLLDLQVDTSTPTGKMILTVMAAVAELERNTIAERTKAGRAAKAANPPFAALAVHTLGPRRLTEN